MLVYFGMLVPSIKFPLCLVTGEGVYEVKGDISPHKVGVSSSPRDETGALSVLLQETYICLSKNSFA